MKIAAVGDIHHPLYTPLLRRKLEAIGHVDIFLFAGDNVDPGYERGYQELARICVEYADHTVAVFGNTDNPWLRSKIREDNPEITFLEEEATWIEDLYIIGSQGLLERPTNWQRRNIPDIEEIYRHRYQRIKEILAVQASHKMLLTHYSPTIKTMMGERPDLYPLLGADMEQMLIDNGVKVAVHAHSHYGKARANVNGVEVFNVSIPLMRDVTIFDL